MCCQVCFYLQVCPVAVLPFPVCVQVCAVKLLLSPVFVQVCPVAVLPFHVCVQVCAVLAFLPLVCVQVCPVVVLPSQVFMQVCPVLVLVPPVCHVGPVIVYPQCAYKCVPCKSISST